MINGIHMPLWLAVAIPAAACLLSLMLGFILIPYLRRLKFGQPIKTEFGPKWHESKQGTPTMGGIMFILSAILISLLGYGIFRWLNSGSVSGNSMFSSSQTIRFAACLVYCLLFSLIGFADDFIKVAKKHNLGLKAYQKVILQTLFSALFLGALYLSGDHDTSIDLIFTSFDIGIFYYPLMIVIMIYLTNAVNLTDGVDGLCGSVTVVSMMFFCFLSNSLGNYPVTIIVLSVLGAVIGFLYWNYNPAKCFMGDTGSMFLGAAVTSIGIVLHQHLLMVFFALVYILEALSVVIQVSYFKYTAKKHFKATGEKGKGKRIFKMTPIHHHFEMSGFSEYKICFCFSAVQFAAGIVGFLLFLLSRR